MNLSEYNNVFCDSKESIDWAYRNGLPKDALIRTSSPAMLFEGNSYVQHLESRWSVKELSQFQSSIKKLSEDVFDAAMSVKDIELEKAIAISQSSIIFQKILYKAACLNDDDFIKPRLFIYVDGNIGPAGNVMNSPWDELLKSNPLFSMVNYTLKNDEWNVLTTQGVSYLQRLKVAGYKTIVFRLAVKLMKKLPNFVFTRELIMPNENELNIEIAYSLALHGVKVTEICSEPMHDNNVVLEKNIMELYDAVMPIMYKRIKLWVVESAVGPTMKLFMSHLKEYIKNFELQVSGWKNFFVNSSSLRQLVLMNAPGNIKGQTLSYICRKKGIPFIATQHGVTAEINKFHSEVSVGYESGIADAVFYYNSKCAEVKGSSHFSRSKNYIVGMSSRHIRMKKDKLFEKSLAPIVYVSTNLYRGNMGHLSTWHTDYDRALQEIQIVTDVLDKLPHKVLYKTYPEDNRRYADQDPVLNYVSNSKNITLFDKKIDMRYLIANHRVVVTSGATSTLSWPVMSGKPIVFINRKEKSPLSDDAHISLSKGLFVFDDDNNLHSNLKNFLSQPLTDIERLWKRKEGARKEMIREYFSEYNNGSGKRAAQIILKEYL